MSPTLRRADARDADQLHAVAAATFPLACPPGTSAEDSDAFIAEHLSVARFRGYLAARDRDLLVAIEDGSVVGYTMLVAGEPDADIASAIRERPSALLSKCYLLPSAQGSGLAATLVEATVEAARARGVRSVWLGVNEENVRANRFYEKVGFARVGTRRFLVGGRLCDDVVRERVLPPPIV